MYRFIQFDAVTGRALGSLDTCELDADGAPVSPDGVIMIDREARPEAAGAIAYDVDRDTFTARPATRRQLTKADVIALLTPEQWAELNRYHPAAADEQYRNADVYWAMSVFLAATRPFDVEDPRVAAVFTKLIAGGAIAAKDAEALQTRLAAASQEAR